MPVWILFRASGSAAFPLIYIGEDARARGKIEKNNTTRQVLEISNGVIKHFFFGKLSGGKRGRKAVFRPGADPFGAPGIIGWRTRF